MKRLAMAVAGCLSATGAFAGGAMQAASVVTADGALRRTQRLYESKWGVFNHFLGGDCRTAEQWNARVDALDAEKIADQLARVGARFYFITLMQGERWMCAPNAAFDSVARVKAGEVCSRRDLPADLAKALSARGIDLYLYYTGDGPYLDWEIAREFGFSRRTMAAGVNRPFVEKWARVLEEFAVRYGDRVKGWWIDGAYRESLKYTNDLLSLYADAIAKGNPDALVAFNDGVKPCCFETNHPREDFTAGEFNDFRVVPRGRFVGRAQAFALIPLGVAANGREYDSWGCGGCKRDAEFVADYVSLVNRAGGVVAIDVKVNPDGSFEPDQLAVLEAVGRRTGTLAVSRATP